MISIHPAGSHRGPDRSLRSRQHRTSAPLVAWDIETCPLPLDSLTPAQERRLGKEAVRLRRQDPELSEDEASRKARSLSPFLGWICCISAVRGSLSGEVRVPRSWSCSEPSGEAELLRSFWSEVVAFPESTLWVTFNGKAFDVPFLLGRSVHHRLAPTQRRLLDTYPYRHRPHADLARVWPYRCDLDGLCDHLGVPTPKDGITGAGVARAVEAGRIDEVVRYCEGDVVATLACLQAMPCVL